MRKTDFFVVGWPKSGTTSLYFYLKQHPEIYMSDYKETKFFATDLKKQSDEFHKSPTFFPIRTWEHYFSLFKNALPNQILGEASPQHIFSKQAAKNMADFNPDAKIILILRNPIDFLYSFHSELAVHLYEPILNFEKALAIEPLRQLDKSKIPRAINIPSYVFYSEWIKYSEQLQRYLDYFPKKQIKIITLDDFKKNTKETCEKIYDFLGISKNVNINYKKYNTNEVVRFKFLRKLINFKIFKRMMMIFLPSKLYSDLNRLIKKIFHKKEKRKPLDPELRKKLMKKFKLEVVKISRLIKRDLVKEWGYDKI